ncbi:MAG TPA: winged helix DNA-binding domain-containing protein [Firmicutes bacterium]|mgnify:CR=1 FL=1|jgi:hypothetical protein|nr:winged helix DNA-binding domain-containing protein [Bacillota bacterium]HHT42119.1 winged helix DNA-binding domain-containing protein [Bacillota bacterium]
MSKEQLLYASLHNLYLLEKAETATIVSDLMGLQSQFANNPKYALQIRASDYSEDSWHRGLVKTWTFRGTLHVVREDELSLHLSAVGVRPWDDRWGIDPKVKPYWAEKLRDWIASGVSERDQLKEKCLEAGMEPELLDKVFYGWGGLLRDMCARGLIAYAPGTKKLFVACNLELMDKQAARLEVIRRYFQAFGPASLNDCAYFTGFRKSEVVKLVQAAGLPLKSVFDQDSELFYLGELPSDGKIPECLFLAGFDQLLMGYRDRSRYLDDKYKVKVTTNTGIVFPTILLHGRLQAKWKKDGAKLLVTPFHRLAKRDRDLIADKAKETFGADIQTVTFAEPD